MRKPVGSLLSCFLFAITSMTYTAQPCDADVIFTGRTIITINDDSPQAEAAAVKDSKIAAAGSKAFSSVQLCAELERICDIAGGQP